MDKINFSSLIGCDITSVTKIVTHNTLLFGFLPTVIGEQSITIGESYSIQ